MALKTLKDHPISASLLRLQELMQDEAFQSPVVLADENSQFNRDKIQNIAKALRSLLNQSAVTMVSEIALNHMNSNLQSPINEITAFVSNKNVAHIANAVNYIDQNVLSYTWAFLPKINPLSKNDSAEIIDMLRENSRKAIEQIVAQKDELAGNIDNLGNDILVQENRLAEIKQSQDQLRAEMAASVSNLETSFNKSQLQRDNEFSELLSASREDLSQAQNEFRAEAFAIIESLRAHKSDAERIVQVIGDIGVTGNYQKIANSESEQANLWRWITIGLFACGIIMAAATFYKFYHEPVTGTNTLGRVM